MPRRAASASQDASPERRLSHTRLPAGWDVAAWQAALRRQFGREQNFEWQHTGDAGVFSDYVVHNPQSGGRYRVALRGTAPGDNFCACPDFATNELGTCKHIEFVLARIEAKRGGKAALARGFKPDYSEVYLRYGAHRQVCLRCGTGFPDKLGKRASTLFSADGLLDPARYGELDAFVHAVRRSGHELRCYDDAMNHIAQWRDAGHRREVLAAAYPRGARSAALKKLLNVPLYAYQAEGALFTAQAGRVLIGDEMGLGKTVQAIAAAELFGRHFGAERVLVVCPTSLKHQWQREFERFASREAQVVHGVRTMRQRQFAAPGTCKITNYDTISRDLDLIAAFAPDLVIVDEAQRVKNWNTIAARALRRIESPYAIVLTGTPLENRLEELVSIVQYVDPWRLGPTWRLLHEHQQRDEAGRVVGYRDLGRIGQTLAPVMLRRRKAEVLEQLPSRMDKTCFVPMTDQQWSHHEENALTVSRIVNRWRRTGWLSDADQLRLTCALQNMRMSCNSTYLLDGETDHGHKADELMALLDDLFEQPGAKAVVFSQWVRTHELIARRLQARGIGHVLFTGSVPGDKRGALVERFHDDAGCRVFLSTDAGSAGLNLQHAAATVINMDLPWNPAVLEQRIGRVHRLGQAKGVQVVNFVAEGTIEESMLGLLAFKRSLFAGVLDGGESDVFLEGSRLSRFMKSVDEVTGSMAQAPAPGTRTEADEAAVEALASKPPASPDDGAASPAPVPVPETPGNAAVDPWRRLAEAGIALLQTVAAAGGPTVETDPATGRSTLKLPLPDADTLQHLSGMLGQLAALARK